MKLLLDQNLSPHLVKQLADIYSDITHVQSVGLDCASDEELWKFAQAENYIIVTKDADFYERSIFFEEPPKVIWIRRGNCSTNEIESMMRSHIEDVKRLVADEVVAVLMLF